MTTPDLSEVISETPGGDVLTSPNSDRIALVVPSIRDASLKRFVDEWRSTGLFDLVDLILVEDNPTKTFTPPMDVTAAHFCWHNIDQYPWSWIIPRRSDTVRSFGYWWAWQAGYGLIMTLDDDCYPSHSYLDPVGHHVSMLSDRTRWYNTLNSVIPRGMPYYNRGSRGIHVNHGLWEGVLDYDAPHQLVNPVPEIYDHSNRIVPYGAYFPMCGMNVMWRREATPLMYHLLMGQAKPDYPNYAAHSSNLEKLPFDRFGDIWCGIIMKKVADHLGWGVSTGTPYIHHDRASNPFTNLRKEANGIEVNEWFWEKIDAIELEHETPAYCYGEIGREMMRWDGEHTDYWSKLGHAMQTWADLFKSK